MLCWHCGTPMKEEGECPFCKATNPRPDVKFEMDFYIGVKGPFVGQLYKIPNNLTMPCDGRLLDREEYPELYELLDNRFGGDETQFCLPDFRPREAKTGTHNVRLLEDRVTGNFPDNQEVHEGW